VAGIAPDCKNRTPPGAPGAKEYPDTWGSAIGLRASRRSPARHGADGLTSAMSDDREDLRIPPSDEELLKECRIETFRSGGPGGQHQNTTDSGVRLVHLPTGIRVVARTERSQLRNRRLALERLRKRLEEAQRKAPERVPSRVPEREKRKRLEEKRIKGEKKRLRRPPDPERD
jgi:ribosome-associated protein